MKCYSYKTKHGTWYRSGMRAAGNEGHVKGGGMSLDDRTERMEPTTGSDLLLLMLLPCAALACGVSPKVNK